MSETGDMQHATEQAATDDGTQSVPTDQALLTPHLTTDSDATDTAPASSEPTGGQIEGVEVYGNTPPDAPEGQQRRKKRVSKPRKPAATLSIRQSAYVANLTNPDSPTYGNKLQSAKSAGYSVEHAYSIAEIPAVSNAIEAHLKAVNADSKVRLGVLASLMHKGTVTAEQYSADEDGTLRLVSKTVTDNDKVRLQAAKELGKLDGSYARATTIAHGQRKVLDAALSQWTKRLRASLAPQTSASVGDAQAIDVDATCVDGSAGQPDAVAGQGSALGGIAGAGTDATDGGEGG